MHGLSLEAFQLVHLSLRLLPSYCLICFSSVLLTLRYRIGLGKTQLDKITLSLTKDVKGASSWQTYRAQTYNISIFMILLLAIGCALMARVLLQFTGLTKPGFIFKFYPDYRSQKLKKKKAVMDTSSYIYNFGFLSFVLCLILGSALTVASRVEITDQRKKLLADSLRDAMTTYKLKPWEALNMNRTLDIVQTKFGCCGINGFQDFYYTPRPLGVAWKDLILERMREQAKGLSENPERLGQLKASKPFPMSCCMTTETGQVRNCSRKAHMHKFGCFVRVLQYMKFRQNSAELWGFYTGVCIALIGSMAYWVQIM